ncbi:MAG: UDP-N-acetylglucosamine 1-carboxyvinyltransferase [Coriobacteriales bacterium]
MNESQVIVVRGGNEIRGDVRIGGAKNSALKLMAASVMAAGEVTLDNVPCISDVGVMVEVLRVLGASVEEDPAEPHTLHIDTAAVDRWETPYELVAKMRASISILGPLIARFGKARVAMPGGCQIGARKLDMHITSLEALGVVFATDHGFIEATTPNGLHGAEVVLDFPSVGATENLMLASSMAQGTTIIRNAACEPEIEDLASFVNSMGGNVSGAGTPVIVINGVDSMHGTRHRTVGDRIEAGTFLVAGALAGGPVTVHGVSPEHLALALRKLADMGCTVETGEDWVSVSRSGALAPADIQTLPHPGFPTDLQAQFMVLDAVAQGTSIVTENVFENRFMFASELSRMGADIRIDGHHALITGVKGFSAAPVSSTDLRGGAALVIAALVADGETRVDKIYHIDRGYEDYVGKLRALGADIERR